MTSVLSSGEMSRACGLSAKALRLYHAKGLLVPAHIDPGNGYRRYTAEQVERGRTIALLRRLDMPLARIAEVVDGPIDGARERILDWWQGQLYRIDEGRDLLRRLDQRFATDNSIYNRLYSVKRRAVPERKLATMFGDVEQHDLVPRFTADVVELRGRLAAQGATFGDEFWVVYHSVVGPRIPGRIETCVPYEGKADPSGPMMLRMEPAGEIAVTAVTVRHCRYPTILGAFNAVEQDTTGEETGRPREVYPVPWSDDPDAVVAEVAITVLSRG